MTHCEGIHIDKQVFAVLPHNIFDVVVAVKHIERVGHIFDESDKLFADIFGKIIAAEFSPYNRLGFFVGEFAGL